MLSLYKRLYRKFNIGYDVVCNSLIKKKNEIYEYEGVEINKISYPVEIEKFNGLLRKIHVLFLTIYEFYFFL